MNIMKIPPYQTNGAESAAPADGKANTPGKTATTGVASDRVQLSQSYMNLANAQKSISGPQEIRTDKVEQIKGQIDSGSYQINPGAIAGNMLNEIM